MTRDAHDHFVSRAGLRELRDQRVAVIVPTPNDLRFVAYLGSRRPHRREMTSSRPQLLGICVALAPSCAPSAQVVHRRRGRNVGALCANGGQVVGNRAYTVRWNPAL